ncbi:MAG TPA: hypothetical protein VJV05_11445 [Pyrinomonadaceae bacterium]|nr:hypothetical protein [Pyrinomonadaceae bacterium]
MLRGQQTIGVLLLALMSVYVAAAQDNDVAREFDPGIKLDIDAGRYKYDVYTWREKSEEVEGGAVAFGGGVRFRIKPVLKTFIDALDTDKQHVFVGRFGYEYRRASEGELSSHTHSLMFDGTFRWGLPKKILMSDMNRFELRRIDGGHSFRYWNRLRFEKPIRPFNWRIAPFAAGEAYWDGRYRMWNKFTYAGGVEVDLIRRRASVDLLYRRERCITCPDQHTDVFGVNLNVFLRLKK